MSSTQEQEAKKNEQSEQIPTNQPEASAASDDTQIAPLEDLKKLFSRVKDSLLRSSTSFEAIQEASNLVSILSAQIIAAANPLSEEQSKFFYKEFFKEICTRAANCESINGPTQEAVAELLRSLTDLLAAELRMQTPTCLELASLMKPVFSDSSKLHRNAFQKTGTTQKDAQASGTDLSDLDGCIPEAEIAEDERMWRLALDIGKEVDVLKRDPKRKVQMWSKGKIVATTGSQTEISKKRLTIKFIQDVSVSEGSYLANSRYIAPYGTLSICQNWREEIKKGDLVDAMDKNDKWSTATVVWIDSRQEENTTMYMLRVGFRQYYEGGDKSDSMGKYDGYSDQLDEYIGMYTCKIQKPYSQTTLKDIEGNSVAMDPKTLAAIQAKESAYTLINEWEKMKTQDEKDMKMITKEGQLICAIEREGICESTLLIELLSRFFEAHGFAHILAVLSNPDTPLQSVHDLATIVSSCYPLYHKSFVDAYFEGFKNQVEGKLDSADEQQLKLTRFSTIEEIVDMLWIQMMSRVQPEKERQIGKYQLLTKLGILFLKQKFVQKRIDGASAIDTVCNRALQQKGTTIKDTIKQEKGDDVVETLVNTLKEADIINLYFNRSNIHEEMVKRAGGILSLFLSQEILSEEQLDFIWSNCSEDTLYRALVQDCLKNIASKVNPNQLVSIIERVCMTPKKKIKEDEIDLVMSLCFENVYNAADEPIVKLNQSRVLTFYWEYLTDESADEYLNKIIANKTMFNFMDILKSQGPEMNEFYFDKIQQEMQSNKSSAFISIKIAYRIFKELKITNKDLVSALADKIQEKHQLMELIIKEIQQYQAKVNEQVTQQMQAVEASGKTFDDSKLHESVYCGAFPHKEQITERIEFLTIFAQECATKLTKDCLARLWVSLVDNNQIKFDKKQLFSMLKNFVDVALADQESKIITLDDLQAFYRECIAGGLSDFTNLDIEGFICIQGFFILINNEQKRLTILTDGASQPAGAASKKPADQPKSILKNSDAASGKVTSISSDKGAVKQQLDFSTQTSQIDTTQSKGETGNSAITGGTGNKQSAAPTVTPSITDKDGKVNLIMNVAPSELEGTAGLWRIAAQAENGKVSDAVVNLLIQIHTHLDASLMDRLSEFEDLYISSCIDVIQENLKIIAARTPEQKAAIPKAVSLSDKKKLLVQEKRISNTFKSLTQLIKNSEKDGTFDLISHRAFAQDSIIKDIVITNEFNYEANTGYQSTFKLDLKSNMNMLQVKKLICSKLAYKPVGNIQETPPHPSAIKIVLKRYLERQIADRENGMLISELFLRTGERIVVQPRGNEDILNMSLIDTETKKFSAKARAACRILFEKFAIASPESPDLLYLGTEQIKELTEKVSDKASLRPLSILAYNTNEDINKFLYPDFLGYYEQMSTEQPEMVRENLKYIGIRSDMKNIPKPGDPDDILNQHKRPQDMPRFKIANNQRCFETLLSCLDLEPDTKRDANEVINQACTNQRIQGDVLEVGPTMFGWDNVTSGDGAKEVVYTLTMVEQILYNSDETERNPSLDQSDSLTKTRELKRTWVTRFLKSGGLNKLIAMMEKGLSELKQLRVDLAPDSDAIVKLKEVLTVTMKIVGVFVSAAVCGIKNDLDADVFSIKQSLSALSRRLQQGNITSIITHKQLRRADKQEIDLEERLEKACVSKVSSSSFFGLLTPKKPEPVTQGTSGSADKQNDSGKTDTQPTEITQDLLFGDGDNVTHGCEPPPEKHNEDQQQATDEQPVFERQVSKETKQVDKKRINFLEVTDRYRQITKQICEAMTDPAFDIAIDFNRLHDFCLEATASCVYSEDKQQTHDRAFIRSSLEVWSACVIHLGGALKWERKPENISEKTMIHNLNEFVCQVLTCSMPEVRRFMLQNLSLACEFLSNETNSEPFEQICQYLINHMKLATPACRIRMSEEIYEMLGDACFAKYYIDRRIKNDGQELNPEEGNTYKESLIALIGAIKNHNSFLGNEQTENLGQAKALESLLLATADVFSFYNKQETYDSVHELLKEHQLIDYIYYEVLFFVPEKTESPNRNKARRMETRKAGFQLLFKILKFLRPSDFLQFLTNQFEPMTQFAPRPSSWDHQPSERIRRAEESIGIRNLGNVCYMISMLQQFYWVPAFRYGLLKVLDESEPNMVEYKEQMIDDNMLRQLQLLLGGLELSERAMVDPTEFCFSLKQMDGQPTNPGIQRDAQEFLNEFFDKIENVIKGTSQEHLLADIFQGSTIQQKVCQSCKNVTRQTQPFFTQTLYVENNKDVYESLQKGLEGEMINDFKCEACKQQVDLRSQHIMGKLPNVLILHLQRIAFDYATLDLKKLPDRFEFPLLLDLFKYSAKNNINLTEEEKADPNNKQILDMMSYQDEDYVYRLTGVCIHRGRANSGHYWSLIHLKRGSQEPDSTKDEWSDLSQHWKEFNDERVGFFYAKNLEEQGYGGYMTESEIKAYAGQSGEDWSKSAYMLVYERKRKTDIRQVVQDKESDSVDMVKFNEMPKEIPAWIEDAIKKDNRAHVADTQIFHPLFFAFASQLLKHTTAELLDQEEDYGPDQQPTFIGLQQMVMNIGHKLSFDLLSHFKDVDSTKSICASLRSVFSWSDPVKEFALSERPSLLHSFIKKVLHEDKCSYFLKIMYDSNSSSTVRDSIGRTVCRVITKGIKVVLLSREDPARKDLPVVSELHSILVDVVGWIFAVLKDRQFQQKWNKVKEYFTVLADIGIDDKYQVEFLLDDLKLAQKSESDSQEGNDDIVTSICDFMLQQKSPNAKDEPDPRVEMGGSYNKPAFGHLVSLVSHLVRCQHTKQSTESQPTFATNYTKGEKQEEINMMDKKFDLPQKAIEFFTNSDLFELILSCDYHVGDYAEALAHVCYGNAELSKKVCKMAIECRYEGSRANYLKVLRQQLKLHDKDATSGESLQIQRLQWVFGSTQPSYTVIGEADSGVPVQVGLASLGFDIDSEAFTYDIALNEESYDDNVSVLKLMLKSYNVQQLASDQVSGISKKKNANKSSASAVDEIAQSTLKEQLQAQNMPEDQMNNLLQQMAEDPQNQARQESRARSKSDQDAPQFNPTVGVKVDQYMDLEPLEQLVRIIANNETTMDFFASLPAFTYQCVRYTDWIGQYIAVIEAQVAKDSKLLSSDQRASFKVIRNLYVKYISFVESLNSQPKPEETNGDVNMIDTSKAAPKQESLPINYLILKANSGDDAGINVESNGVTLTATRIACSFVKSQPNGVTNLSVPQSVLNQFGSKQPTSQGDQDQAVPDNLSNEADAGFPVDGEQGQSASQSNFVEPETINDLKVELNNPAVQHALTFMSINDEYMWIFEQDENDRIMCLENMFKEVVFEKVKEYYKEQAEKNGTKVSFAPAAEPAPAKEDPKNEKQTKADENMASGDPFEAWKGEPIEVCEDLVYVLTLKKSDEKPFDFKISFREGPSDQKINLIWPRQGLIGAIKSSEATKIVAVLAKKDAQGEISVLNELQKLEVCLVAEVDEEQLKKEKGGSAGENGGDNKGMNASKNDVSIGGEALGMMSDEKQCGACTSFNSIDALQCCICLTTFQD